MTEMEEVLKALFVALFSVSLHCGVVLTTSCAVCLLFSLLCACARFAEAKTKGFFEMLASTIKQVQSR